ncbi:hypothetical protein HanIR_Chr07g0307251 [Helianthus annuus]|nr:hypothetical protein HanIR_Chr07g0307251 [Helianthus annuus]
MSPMLLRKKTTTNLLTGMGGSEQEPLWCGAVMVVDFVFQICEFGFTICLIWVIVREKMGSFSIHLVK